MFIGRTDAKAETPILWPPHVMSWLIGKDPNSRRDWGQEEKESTEDKMAEWHHWPDAHEFGWTLEVGDGQGGLACCDSWGRKEWDMTQWLNWTNWFILIRWLFSFKPLPFPKAPFLGWTRGTPSPLPVLALGHLGSSRAYQARLSKFAQEKSLGLILQSYYEIFNTKWFFFFQSEVPNLL